MQLSCCLIRGVCLIDCITHIYCWPDECQQSKCKFDRAYIPARGNVLFFPACIASSASRIECDRIQLNSFFNLPMRSTIMFFDSFLFYVCKHDRVWSNSVIPFGLAPVLRVSEWKCISWCALDDARACDCWPGIFSINENKKHMPPFCSLAARHMHTFTHSALGDARLRRSLGNIYGAILFARYFLCHKNICHDSVRYTNPWWEIKKDTCHDSARYDFFIMKNITLCHDSVCYTYLCHDSDRYGFTSCTLSQFFKNVSMFEHCLNLFRLWQFSRHVSI